MTHRLVLSLCVLLTTCGRPHGQFQSDPQLAALQDTIAGRMDRLASAVSRRDAQAVAEGVLLDSGVVYVSDGRVIRGYEYIPVLAEFYGGLASLDFGWRWKEVRVLSDEAAVATGLADIIWADTLGGTAHNSAVFTNVYHRIGVRWQMVAVQKTTYRQKFLATQPGSATGPMH